MKPCVPLALATFAALSAFAPAQPTWGGITLKGKKDQAYPVKEVEVLNGGEDLPGVTQLFLKTAVGEVILTLPQDRTSCGLYFSFDAAEGRGSAAWKLGERRPDRKDFPFVTWDSDEFELEPEGKGTGTATYRVVDGKISGKFKIRVARRRSETKTERFDIEGEFKDVPLKKAASFGWAAGPR